MMLLIMQFLSPPLTSSLFGSNSLISTLFSNTLSLFFSLNIRDQVSHPYRTKGKIVVLYILIYTFLNNTHILLRGENFHLPTIYAYEVLSNLLTVVNFTSEALISPRNINGIFFFISATVTFLQYTLKYLYYIDHFPKRSSDEKSNLQLTSKKYNMKYDISVRYDIKVKVIQK
jgi:hypothetical protein